MRSSSANRDCGLAYAFATVATDGVFFLGELAIGAGIAGVSVKALKSLKFILRRRVPGKIEVEVKNPNGGSYTKEFSESDLAAKYGKPDDNHQGVLTPDTNRNVKESLSKDKYERLRRRTPSEKIKRDVRSQYPTASSANPVDDEWLPGMQRTAPVEADHIVSMKQITEMRGFSSLSETDQLDVLNMRDNFTGLSRSANGSKGDLSFEQWTMHKKSGTPVNPDLRDIFMQREAELRKALQEEIDKRLSRYKNETPSDINFRD